MSSINILYPKQDTIVYDTYLNFRYDIQNNLKKNYLKYVVVNLDGIETKINWKEKSFKLVLAAGGAHKLTGYLEDVSGKKIQDTDFTMNFYSIGEKYQSENKIWKVIADKLPLFIRDDYKTFTKFVEAYYEWIHKSNNPLYTMYSSEDFSNIEKSPEIFLEKFRINYLNDFPNNILELKETVNIKTIIKNIKTFYSSKGSEKSFKFLFRLMFNSYVQVFYPRTLLFRASGNLWVENKYLKIRGFESIPTDRLKNSIVYQYSKSDPEKIIASARIINVVVKKVENEIVYELQLENIIGKFGVNSSIENLTNYVQNGELGEEAYVDILEENSVIKQKVYLVDNVVNINISNPGLVPGDIIIALPINGSTGTSFSALVVSTDTIGIPTEVRILNTGYDYRGSLNNFEIFVVREGFNIKINGSIFINKVFFEPGYYENRTSEPSGNNVIQDNRKYQELSYVLKSEIREEDFLDVVKRLIHPAGFAIYTEPYIEKMDFFTASQKEAKANIYYKPLIGNHIAYRINSSINLRKTINPNVLDMFPNGYDNTAPLPSQSNPNLYFVHEPSTNGPINTGVDSVKFGFTPNVSDIDKRNEYWVVYPNLSHIIGSFKQIKDLKIKEVIEILATRLTL